MQSHPCLVGALERAYTFGRRRALHQWLRGNGRGWGAEELDPARFPWHGSGSQGSGGTGTEVAPGGAEAAAHGACGPGTRESTLLDLGAFKAALSCCLFWYPHFIRSGEVSPVCLYGLFSRWAELIMFLYREPVLKRKQMGTGIAPNTVILVNASQQQQGKSVDVVKVERNPA